MSQLVTKKCFVIMPFGVKEFNDGSGRTYNFDKVYRVIIQKAIRQAGLEPIRADESRGTNLIHQDMFKEIRDRPVVLADLSLSNPNVFYELGIRHTISPTGTVLICREGTDLPFDVKLSRVIFYGFDGQSLDFEEVEKVIQKLQPALEEAKQGNNPDSPVHALLDSVLPPSKSSAQLELVEKKSDEGQEFQQMVASYWINENRNLLELLDQYKKTVFGIRAVGYVSLQSLLDPPTLIQIATALYYKEQYDLANQLYEQVPIDSPYFEPKDYIRYGSSISEEHPDLENANKGFEIQKISLNSLNPLLEQSEDLDIETGKKVAHCYDSMGDLLLWKYQLSKDIKDLEMGIEYLSNGMSYSLKVIEQGGYVPCGGTAMSHLKLMIYLRIKENDASRLDLEHQRDAILKLKPQPGDSYIEKSYLRWFQAIAIADQGDEQRSMRAALMAFAEDSKTKVQDEEQGGFTKHVYNIVRRFILQHLDVLNNPTSLGLISQILQNPQ